MAAIGAREVREHLERVVSSTQFADSERLRRFLRFTVDSKLEGRDEPVKEYVLGREVFDRPDDYDPRIDPIVRVEARRLRTKLAQYYGGPGRHDAIRLEYPKGTYLPEIRPASKTQGAAARSFRPFAFVFAALVAFALIALAVAAYRVMTGARTAGMVAVIPAQWVWENPGMDSSAVDLSEALSSQIANGRRARVVAWPIVVQQHHPGKPLPELARDLGASELIVPVVRRIEGYERVTLFLIDPATGQKLNAARYTFDAMPFAADDVIARRMVRDLAASGALR